MSDYRVEIFGIDITCLDEHMAKIEAFDEETSSITAISNPHTVESWRELSAKIEEALMQIHHAKV